MLKAFDIKIQMQLDTSDEEIKETLVNSIRDRFKEPGRRNFIKCLQVATDADDFPKNIFTARIKYYSFKKPRFIK